MTEAEQWLSENTFWCEALVGRISPAQCQNNRKLAKTEYVDRRPSPCAYCQEWPTLCAQVERKIKDREDEGEEMSLIDCLYCGAQDVKNFGRGLCGKCYVKMPDNTRREYSIDDARQKRMARMQQEAAAARMQQKGAATKGKSGQEDGGKAYIEAEEQLDVQSSPSSGNSDPLPEPEAKAEGDPLEGAQIVMLGHELRSAPRAKVSKSCRNLYFSAAAVQEFSINTFQACTPYRKDESIMLHMASKGTLKLTGCAKKGDSLSMSIRSLAKILGWRGGEVFRVNGTSRPDVVYLVKEDVQET